MPARRMVEELDRCGCGSGAWLEACCLVRRSCEGVLEGTLGLAPTRLMRLTGVTYSSLREPPGERVRIPGAPTGQVVAA
jgi:hypothetical protein